MKLFLASLANQTLDLILPLLPASPAKLKVAFIPTAADTYKDKPWVENDRVKLRKMGFNFADYDIKGKTQGELLSDLSSYDIIHITGGNSFYLLHQMNLTGFKYVLKTLLDAGKIYVGSSAGSCVLGPDLDAVKTLEHPEDVPELNRYVGLELIKERIVPHWGKEKYLDRQKLIEEKWGDRILKLSDNQVLVIDGNSKKVLNQ